MTIDLGACEFRATARHPFWVIRGDDLENRPRIEELAPFENEGESLPGRWVFSHDLRVGDELFLQNQGNARIHQVSIVQEELPVYNLTIAELHNFAVGESCALVHNTSASGPKNAAFADNAKLTDHFTRHGGDFGARIAPQYERQAAGFLNGPRSTGVLEKVRPNGDVVRYNPATEEFGVIKPDGTIRTYFKPDPAVHGYPSNLDYYNAQ